MCIERIKATRCHKKKLSIILEVKVSNISEWYPSCNKIEPFESEWMVFVFQFPKRVRLNFSKNDKSESQIRKKFSDCPKAEINTTPYLLFRPKSWKAPITIKLKYNSKIDFLFFYSYNGFLAFWTGGEWLVVVILGAFQFFVSDLAS